MSSTRWHWVGERALLRSFEGDLLSANASARDACEQLVALGAPEIEDVVLAARSVLVVLEPGAEPSPELIELLDRETSRPLARSPGRVREIAVRYGGEDGPDLPSVAEAHGMTEEQVVRAHVDVEYTVGFIGFSPGFPYLLGLDARLATSRLDSPRVRVPAGSVGIGGAYTGIYPRSTPGGWRLIGRADVELFDPARDPPALLTAGDRVRFVAR